VPGARGIDVGLVVIARNGKKIAAEPARVSRGTPDPLRLGGRLKPIPQSLEERDGFSKRVVAHGEAVEVDLGDRLAGADDVSLSALGINREAGIAALSYSSFRVFVQVDSGVGTRERCRVHASLGVDRGEASGADCPARRQEQDEAVGKPPQGGDAALKRSAAEHTPRSRVDCGKHKAAVWRLDGRY
jgi:hypothetical protein